MDATDKIINDMLEGKITSRQANQKIKELIKAQEKIVANAKKELDAAIEQARKAKEDLERLS